MSAGTAGHPASLGKRTYYVELLLTAGAALICGFGIFGTFLWLYNFDEWMWFPSVIVLAVGCYLLFTRITGPDHA